MVDNIAIVVIAFNRIDSVNRLINSLKNAYYTQKVDLIISIDNSGTDIVENYAETIKWNYGKKIIKTFKENLGLRKHVLACGDYINEYDYDAIVVLEDDIVVSECFFSYTMQTVEKYQENKNIAGISLYNHSWNLTCDRPFNAVNNGFDVYFMQHAQSWGQVWMKEQWNDFYNWYKNEEYKLLDKDKVPKNILNWPASSWLKYHIQYCIHKKKYFVYPHISLSTNFADAGTHYAFSTNKMQVPLNISKSMEYRLPDEIYDTSVYDVYHENCGLAKILNIDENLLEVSMYGLKNVKSSARYLLTTNILEYKVIKKFALQMRPWELNIFYNIEGEGIYLYDLSVKDAKNKVKHKSLVHWIYDTRGEVLLKRNFIDIIFNEIYNKLRKK